MSKHKSEKKIERMERGNEHTHIGHAHSELGKLEGHALNKRHHRC